MPDFSGHRVVQNGVPGVILNGQFVPLNGSGLPNLPDQVVGPASGEFQDIGADLGSAYENQITREAGGRILDPMLNAAPPPPAAIPPGPAAPAGPPLGQTPPSVLGGVSAANLPPQARAGALNLPGPGLQEPDRRLADVPAFNDPATAPAPATMKAALDAVDRLPGASERSSGSRQDYANAVARITDLLSQEGEQISPKELLDKPNLLKLGLNMMVAGSRPGATTVGSLGLAGAATLQDMEERRDKKSARELKSAEAQMQSALQTIALDRGQASDDIAQKRLEIAQKREAREAAAPRKAPSGYQYGDTGALEPIPGGPADPSVKDAGRAETVTSEIVLPYLQTILAGEKPTPEQQEAFDEAKGLDLIEKIKRTIGQQMAARTGADEAELSSEQQVHLRNAKAALARGGDREQVAARLEGFGISRDLLNAR